MIVLDTGVLPVSESIWLASVELVWAHRDPADRVIVATAQERGCPLVTQDLEIRGFLPSSVWQLLLGLRQQWGLEFSRRLQSVEPGVLRIANLYGLGTPSPSWRYIATRGTTRHPVRAWCAKPFLAIYRRQGHDVSCPYLSFQPGIDSWAIYPSQRALERPIQDRRQSPTRSTVHTRHDSRSIPR